MNPKTALEKLHRHGQSDESIAALCKVALTTIWRIRTRGQDPTWTLGQALIALAEKSTKRGKK